VRENRTHGSEGGEVTSLPLSQFLSHIKKFGVKQLGGEEFALAMDGKPFTLSDSKLVKPFVKRVANVYLFALR